MKSALCKKLGIEFPLFAFSHCRDVVAEVSKAGGFGVLGAVAHTPETLEIDLKWIDAHIDGKPYGIDLLIPNKMEDKEGGLTIEDLEARVPPEHRKYVADLLTKHGIETTDMWTGPFKNNDTTDNLRESGATRLLDVAFGHPIKLFVNALGVPPPAIMKQCRDKGILVGALTGAKEHAVKHAQAGVDILVVAGTEAGGHCGEVSTIVLVPEVLRAIADFKNIDVLAAGGIATGRQMAACMAMGAAGAWTASVWLTTAEAETIPTVKKKMLAATSRDTIRSRSRTGKPTRQLKSAWTDAWYVEGAPDPLPMPLQGLVSRRAMARIDKLAESGHAGAKELATYYVGQAVGLMNQEQSARSVVYDFMQDYAEAVERLSGTLDDYCPD
jgi:NAD(P)H-dependent flavin oxidoreductase YrpB (nitropropane dioxygenase family)